jgi:SHS2 domain-containing protein
MFQFLDHPSETLIEVTAPTVAEIFQDAATALFEVMTDTSALKQELQFSVSLHADDRGTLLIEWLNRLIFLHEVEHVFLARFDVDVRPGWSLTALATGQTINENQEKRSHVKSATFGSFDWIERDGGHTVRFVLDV